MNPGLKTWLRKLNIDKGLVEKWINLASEVLFPSWLQQHPDKYLNKLISISNRKIHLQLQGEHELNQLIWDPPDTVSVRHIGCYEGYTPKHPMQGRSFDTSSLQNLIERNRHKGSAYCMKIMGLAIYAFHKWRD